MENVKVPAENLIGEINKGWTYAKFLLGHERANIAGVGIAKRELSRVKKLAADVQRRGRPLLDDPLFAAKVSQSVAGCPAIRVWISVMKAVVMVA